MCFLLILRPQTARTNMAANVQFLYPSASAFLLAAILFVLAKSLIAYSLLENADTDAGQRTPDKPWKTDDGKTDKRWKKLIMVRSEPISIQYFVMDHVNNKA